VRRRHALCSAPRFLVVVLKRSIFVSNRKFILQHMLKDITEGLGGEEEFDEAAAAQRYAPDEHGGLFGQQPMRAGAGAGAGAQSSSAGGGGPTASAHAEEAQGDDDDPWATTTVVPARPTQSQWASVTLGGDDDELCDLPPIEPLPPAPAASAALSMPPSSRGRAKQQAPPPQGQLSGRKRSAPASGDAGKKLYESICTSCHTAGVAGAPKLGDKAAWAPRIATGMDTLYASAIKGKGAMPAKGGSGASDDAIKAAVQYMVADSK
jgi:cytochrome c5